MISTSGTDQTRVLNKGIYNKYNTVIALAIRCTGALEDRTENQLLPVAHQFMQMLNCLVPLRLAPSHRGRQTKYILGCDYLACQFGNV